MSLFKSSIVVTSLSLGISAISFLNQIILANYFGASKAMDIYLLASSIPLMCTSLISAGLSYSFIPHLIKMELKYASDFKLYLGQFIKHNMFYLFIIALIGSLLSFILIPIIYSKLNAVEIEQSRIISIISWLGFITGISFSIITCVFNAKKEFYTPLILSFLQILLTIVIISLYYKCLGIISVALGVLLGSIFSIVVGLVKIRNYFQWQFKGNIFNNVINKYNRELKFAILAALCFTVHQSIDAFWAPKIGPSNLSYLGYCSRVLIALGALILTGPSTVLVPRLTISLNENREVDFFKDVTLVIKIVISLSSVFAMIFISLGPQIIKIVFERGAFTAQDTVAINSIIPFMFSAMVFMVAVVILFRVLFLRETGSKLAVIGIIGALVYFVISGIFSILMGVKGIALAYLVTWILLFYLSLNRLFKKNSEYIITKSTTIFIFKQCILLFILYLTVINSFSLLTTYLNDNYLYELVIHTLASSCLGLIVYAIVSIKIVKQKEIIYLFRELRQLLNHQDKQNSI